MAGDRTDDEEAISKHEERVIPAKHLTDGARESGALGADLAAAQAWEADRLHGKH